MRNTVIAIAFAFSNLVVLSAQPAQAYVRCYKMALKQVIEQQERFLCEGIQPFAANARKCACLAKEKHRLTKKVHGLKP